MLALAAAQVVGVAQPAWAQDNGGDASGGGASGGGSNAGGGNASGGGQNGAGNANVAPTHTPTTLQPFSIGSSGRRWFANSAAKLTAPLRMLFRRTERASAHAANGIVHGGESTLDWLTNRVRTVPDDQDKALAAVKDGEIVPLSSVLKTVQKSVPGDVLNVALNRDTVGSWNYTITVLTPQGFYRDVNVDAGKNNVTSIRPH
ncbi:MAG: hypothetical protein E7774_13055 [Bradyrhizobium sp.]|nr:MAG: hypothetical protein E7774_13055 [Bradyrhizobium sp.]